MTTKHAEVKKQQQVKTNSNSLLLVTVYSLRHTDEGPTVTYSTESHSGECC